MPVREESYRLSGASFLAFVTFQKMNTPNNTISQNAILQKADRLGVAASILCAIHCGLAPVLLLALPSFGRVWAHPASHLLVAIFIVPLAVFSILNGYRTHQKRWILVATSIGILLVLIGVMLPAWNKSKETNDTKFTRTDVESQAAAPTLTSSAGCESERCDEGGGPATSGGDTAPDLGCVDNCCPSLQVDESGKASLHIPPAAIVTTLGGLFLITAHIGNLCSCGHACRNRRCTSCA